MSVVKCARRGCDSMCCTVYSSSYGYLCNECFEEMKTYLAIEFKFHSLGIAGEMFMNTTKPNKYEAEYIDKWCDEEFKSI